MLEARLLAHFAASQLLRIQQFVALPFCGWLTRWSIKRSECHLREAPVLAKAAHTLDFESPPPQ